MYEAVLVTEEGILTEGSHTSLFAVANGKLRTTPSSHAILPGITRELVLRLASELSIPVEEKAISMTEVDVLSEIFLTGTTTEITPVTRLNDRRIGDGSPGPITKCLQKSFRDRIDRLVRI